MPVLLDRAVRRLCGLGATAGCWLLAAQPGQAQPTRTFHYVNFIEAAGRCGRTGNVEDYALANRGAQPADYQRAQQALAAEEAASGRDSPQTNICVVNLALLDLARLRDHSGIPRQRPEFDRGQALLLRAMESASRVHGEASREYRMAVNYLIAFYELSLPEEAFAGRLEELVARAAPDRVVSGAGDPRIATLFWYAYALYSGQEGQDGQQARREEAVQLLTGMVTTLERQRNFPRDELDDLYSNLIEKLAGIGRLREAAIYQARLVALLRQGPLSWPPGSYRGRRDLFDTMGGLVYLLTEAGQTAEAAQVQRQLTAAQNAAAPAPAPTVINVDPAYARAPRSTEQMRQEAQRQQFRATEFTEDRDNAREFARVGRYPDAIEAANRFVAHCEQDGGGVHVCRQARLDIAETLATSLRLAGRPREALTFLEGLLAALPPDQRLSNGPQLRLLMAQAYRGMGEVAPAEAIYADLVQQQSLSANLKALAAALLARIYIETDRVADGDNLLAALPAQIETWNGEIAFSPSYELQISRALALVAHGRWADALAIYQPLLARIDQAFPQGHPGASHLRLLVAEVTGRMGGDARPLFRQAVAEIAARSSPGQFDLLDARRALAADLLQRGAHDEAVQVYRDVVDAAQTVHGATAPYTLSARSDWLIAVFLSNSFNTQDLARAQEHAAALRNAGLAGTLGNADRARRFLAIFPDFAWGSGGPVRQQAAPSVFQALQELSQGEADRVFRRRIAREVAGRIDPRLAEMVRRRDGLADRLTSSSEARTSLIAMAAGSFDALLANSQAAAARAELSDLTAAINRDFPRFADLIEARPAEVDAARAVLQPGEALLMIVPGERRTHLMLVRPGREGSGLTWQDSGMTSAVARDLSRRLLADASGTFVGDFEERRAWQQRQAADRPSFDRAAAYRLYRETIDRVAQDLEGVGRLIVVASGPLAGLPFSILVTAPPTGDDSDPAALRQTSWLADRYAIAQVPSVQSLVLLRQTPVTTPGGGEHRLVAVGNPILTGPPSSRGRRGPVASRVARVQTEPTAEATGPANVAALAAMSALPGTASEIDAVTRLVGPSRSTTFTGARATEANVRTTDLSHADILLFATHGLMPDEMMESGQLVSEQYGISEPGLVMTPPVAGSPLDDGFLSAAEVATLRLDADLVFLSACNTATTSDSDGQGISALARAFFYAGARTLVASYWPVDDAAAARLSSRAAELFLSGTPRAQAVAQAARELRNGGSGTEAAWAHPFYWAPFVVIGEGR